MKYKNKNKELSLQQTKDRNEAIIQDLTLMNNDFFNICFDGHIPSVQQMLRIILDKPDLVVKEVTTQKWIQNLEGHSTSLDIFAVDTTEARFDIEVQIISKEGLVRRARFISSMMDKDALDKGEDYENLPDSYVIFITENDFFGWGLPIYKVRSIEVNTGRFVDDGRYTIFVNGSWRDESPLGKLMQDFHCSNPAEMYYMDLKERVEYFKKSKGGKVKMTDVFEEIRQEGIKEGIKEGVKKGFKKGEKKGEKKGKRKLIKRLHSKGYSKESIKDILGVSDKQIDKLKLTFPAN